jgi:serine-type D-Ala-D-Ala carboxypeptidase (penicillin-binding protein 5/6)
VRLLDRQRGGGVFVATFILGAAILAAVLLAGGPLATAASAAAAQGPPPAVAQAISSGPAGIVAAAADLYDSTTGKRLWSRKLTERRPIASITKVMTALVVIKAGRLERTIKVSAAAVAYARDNDAGSAGLVAGDVLTRRQLLEGLLLPSGADAAWVLAHAYHGGWRAFVRKMNATARKLRMTDTHFANFDGLPWPSEYSTYSTPHSLLILAAAAMRLTTFRAIVGQRAHYLGATRKHHGYSWHTTNLLLTWYPGAFGIKTGFTIGAGYCLLFAARHGRTTLTGVVLDSTSTDPSTRFTAAARLLDWGFAR